jgi:hypothetical protein
MLDVAKLLVHPVQEIQTGKSSLLTMIYGSLQSTCYDVSNSHYDENYIDVEDCLY